jgi:hypothetical protein
MQPFDDGKYDKRYNDIFKPTIEKCGLEAYRIDKDLGVQIPIDDIDLHIQSSDLCLAEITENNPNVWFEIGLAIAYKKEIILVCSKEREGKYPFDIQHRSIISYESEKCQYGLKGAIAQAISMCRANNLDIIGVLVYNIFANLDSSLTCIFL